MKKSIYALALLCVAASAIAMTGEATTVTVIDNPPAVYKLAPADASEHQVAVDAAASSHNAAASTAIDYRPAHAGYPGQVQPYVLRKVSSRAGLDPERAAKALAIKPSDTWQRPWRSTGWPS